MFSERASRALLLTARHRHTGLVSSAALACGPCVGRGYPTLKRGCLDLDLFLGGAQAVHGRFRSPLSHRSSGGSGRITPRSRFDAADLPPRGVATASPRSARLGISSGIGRSPSDGIGRSPSDGPRSSGLSHVIDGFGREGSARENDVPGMEDHAAEALLKGLEGLKGSQVRATTSAAVEPELGWDVVLLVCVMVGSSGQLTVAAIPCFPLWCSAPLQRQRSLLSLRAAACMTAAHSFTRHTTW